MGEVYRAEDTSLGRDVAIKVLPPGLVSDAERLLRFEREARLLATLDHPSIAGIYEVGEAGGVHFLALQLAPGETLAARLERGPLPLEESIAIATRIAEALEAAHARGVVHRDLKPANVMVADDGSVKALDFGLAKAMGEDPALAGDASLSISPTLTAGMTQAGVLLGTAAYMSPEQVRGREAGPQADIWAFGVLLHEMLTGERLFAGETVSDTLAAVLRAPLEELDLPLATPPALRRLLARCLARDASHRLHSVADARLELEAAAEELGSPVAGTPGVSAAPGPARRVGAWIGAAGVALVVGLLLGPRVLPVAQQPEPPRYYDLVFDPVELLSEHFQVSPDGKALAYSTLVPGTLHLRSFEQPVAVELAGTRGARAPVFSPDGQRIGFWQGGRLKSMPRSGGSATVLCEVEEIWHPAWTEDGFIYFSRIVDGYPTVARVSARGGEIESILPLVDESGVRRADFDAQPVGDGRVVLFTSIPGDAVDPGDGDRIMAWEAATGMEREVLADATLVRVLDSGHLAFSPARDQLTIAPFDLDALRLTGPPRPLRETLQPRNEYFGFYSLTLSGTGTLVYEPRPTRRESLVWRDEVGEQPLPVPVEEVLAVEFSPRGERLALLYDPRRDWSASVSLFDLEREIFTPLERANAGSIAWDPDGRSVLVAVAEEKKGRLVRFGMDGTSQPLDLALETMWTRVDSLSPDGDWLSTTRWDPVTDSHNQVALFSLAGGEEAILFDDTSSDEESSAFSPDGRWLAYASERTGSSEVYVKRFPEEGAALRVSVDGGRRPFWDPNAGQPTLYFYDRALEERLAAGAAGSELPRGKTLFKAVLTAGDPPSVSRPEPVLSLDEEAWAALQPGTGRWLILRRPDRSVERLRVITDWFAEIEELFR